MKKYFLMFLLLGICATTIAFVQPKKKKNKKQNTEKVDENIELVWTDNVMKADSISKKTGKPIFGFFTGSDWCGWCHKLQREVFAKQDFKVWAKKNVVLLELDFPRGKQMPDDIKAQNQQLARAFGVQGYPTVMLFTIIKDTAKTNNFNLNAIGQLGYPRGAEQGKEEVKFLQDANEALKAKK